MFRESGVLTVKSISGVIPALFLLAAFMPAPVFAADIDAKAGVVQQLKDLQQRITEMQGQQKEILSNQQKILAELQILKVHIRRRS